MLEKIKKTFTDSCILYTIFVFILLIVYSLLSTPDDGIVRGLSLETSALIFACAVLLRTFHNILYIEKLHFVTRIVINYILVVGSTFGALILIREATNAVGQKPIVSFAILSVLSLAYIGIMVLWFLLRKKSEEKNNEKKEYHSIVKKQ
ncbi:MAG: hypothetical protein IJN48_04070 [Clostridia bacterium]|nr:hypothetical protein [Clostridia bacterium]